jgi:hypothetical protein
MTPLAPDPRTVCHFKLPFTKGWGSRGKRYGIPPGCARLRGIGLRRRWFASTSERAQHIHADRWVGWQRASEASGQRGSAEGAAPRSMDSRPLPFFLLARPIPSQPKVFRH